MNFLLHIGVVIVALGLLFIASWLAFQWQAVEARVQLAQSRLQTLMAAYEDAERLAAARTRFRRRQQAVEGALAAGTSGLEDAHRSFSSRLGGAYDGQPFYARVRRFNSQFGRSVSALFAPESRRHSESLDEWRARQSDDYDADDRNRPVERGSGSDAPDKPGHDD